MDKYRIWSEDELAYLEKYWGKKSIPVIAKNLNRGENAVREKATSIGLGSHLHYRKEITLNQLVYSLGFRKSQSWQYWKIIKNGCPVIQKASIKRKYRLVDIKKFWVWAEKNKHILSFAKFKKGALGPEPEWVDVKRKADMLNPTKKSHGRQWTKNDDSLLISKLKSNKYTYRKLAQEFNRTESAIKRHIYDLKIPYRPIPLDNCCKWTKEENEKLIELYNKGYDSHAISIVLNKSQLSISDRIKKFQ